MSKITVKTEFQSDLRRFPVNIQTSFSEFVEIVSKLYKLDNIRLKYLDEEGDSISITNDEELQEALDFAKTNKNLLRVIVAMGPKPSLLDSWIVVEKLPQEVREICNDIRSLTQQLCVSSDNIPNVQNNNNNNTVTNAPEISPTAAKYYNNLNNSDSTSQPKENLSLSILSGQLPSWGKNSMYAEDFARESNNNNNNNNNNNIIEGPRTDMPKEERKSKISQVVSENSASIVKELKILTSKIASLVIQSGREIPLDIKDDLIQTNMKLAEMTIANCQIQSDNAIENCNQSSALALGIVNSAVENQRKQNYENEASKKNLDIVCDNLRHDTLRTCTNLSNQTTENCLRGANSIRDLIMNL